MRRKKAIKIIKEIGLSCRFLNPRAITLQETDETGHFEIYVENHIDDESWENLKQLAKKRNLGIRLTVNTLVIYAPKYKKYQVLLH